MADCECGHDISAHPPDPNKPFAWPCRACDCGEYREKVEYVSFNDIVPGVHPVCSNAGYRADERERLTPALKAAGYEVGAWRDGERDSFGPLSRCANITKDGKTVFVVYG